MEGRVRPDRLDKFGSPILAKVVLFSSERMAGNSDL